MASPALRNSTSESNVNSHGRVQRRATPKDRLSACRTLSDGARKSYARRKLESEDSSYDSDYECSDSLTASLSGSGHGVKTESQPHHPSGHEDVLRTVSDTLAAEFNEYVCVNSPSFQRYHQLKIKIKTISAKGKID